MYSRGVLDNIKDVMGPRWFDWLLPTPTPGDGIHFSKQVDLEA